MDELFSCRNCIFNPCHSLSIGTGQGYCLQHNLLLRDPDNTTCKYLHRKDLPSFVVDEGISEHAAEFASYSGLVDLRTKKVVPKHRYSERHAWESDSFDPMLHAIAQYFKSKPAWVFIQSFAGSNDARRSLSHASLVRRYMDRCGTWTSSYRLVLAVVQEIDSRPALTPADLVDEDDEEEGHWDVFFARLSGLQEFGFHAGLEDLMWATDTLNGSLSVLNWDLLRADLVAAKRKWKDEIVELSKSEGIFFPEPEDIENEEADVE